MQKFIKYQRLLYEIGTSVCPSMFMNRISGPFAPCINAISFWYSWLFCAYSIPLMCISSRWRDTGKSLPMLRCSMIYQCIVSCLMIHVFIGQYSIDKRFHSFALNDSRVFWCVWLICTRIKHGFAFAISRFRNPTVMLWYWIS